MTSHTYGVSVNGAALRQQMRDRGLTATDVVDLTEGRVSRATVSHALNGRRIHPRKLRAIAAALAKVERIPGIEVLTEAG